MDCSNLSRISIYFIPIGVREYCNMYLLLIQGTERFDHRFHNNDALLGLHFFTRSTLLKEDLLTTFPQLLVHINIRFLVFQIISDLAH